jgi:signal transduction histidine kinase
MTPSGQKRWIYGSAVVYAAIFVIVVGGLVVLYRGARQRLDQSLGARLEAIAVTGTQLVDSEKVEMWNLDPEETIEYLWLVTRFEEIQRANDLAELSLCDPAGFVLISASHRFERGELNTFWQLDREAVDLAAGGFPASSQLYQSGALYQKSAHAPVLDSDGRVVAIVSAEAAVDFFDTLATLRDGALTTGGIVVAFLLLSALAIARLYRASERYRADLLRQENLAAMGRMTAGIAHEIRNPLGVIRGAGQHLQRRLADAGIDDPVADFIPDEIDRLDRILTGYLSFGRGSDSEFESLDLGQVAERVIKLLATDLEEASITVELSYDALPVHGDRQRLQQVIMNLLFNARDAMPEGGTVTVRGHCLGSTCVLTVTDEGTGLGDFDPEALFVAFETHKDKGSGLGLAVSRQIAETHGGTLTLESRTDRNGAIATLTIPATESEA